MTDVVLCGHCRAEQHTDIAVICAACTGRLRSDLLAVPELLTELQSAAARQTSIDHPTGSGWDTDARTLDHRYPGTTAVMGLPVDLAATGAADVVRRAVRTTTVRLAGTIAAQGTVTAPVLPLTGIEPAWLVHHLTVLRRQPYAPTAVRDIGQACARGWTLVDTPPDFITLGTCDTELRDPDHGVALCGWTLTAAVAATTTRCRGCGTSHDVQARRDGMLTAADGILVTAGQAARALTGPHRTVTDSMVRGWRHRGHYDQTDVNSKGQPMYRLGDVREAEHTTRYGLIHGE